MREYAVAAPLGAFAGQLTGVRIASPLVVAWRSCRNAWLIAFNVSSPAAARVATDPMPMPPEWQASVSRTTCRA